MSSYRDKFDIIADMLQVIRQGAKKTEIMYKANLSYLLLNKYLTGIMKFGFVYFERKKRRYLLTDKGMEFLERYHVYSRHNKQVLKRLDDVRDKKKSLERLCNGS